MAIPASVWKSETQHASIWKAQGNCVRCNVKPRDLMCSRCQEPMCAGCLKLHEDIDHARDRYIERLAKGKTPMGTATRQEQFEAICLRRKLLEES